LDAWCPARSKRYEKLSFLTPHEHVLMMIAVLRWLTCVAISAEIVIWSISGAHSIYALIFGVACVGALVFEHGWKIDRKKGHIAPFLVFYVIPFVVVIVAVGTRAAGLYR